jgi:hypothetical protein
MSKKYLMIITILIFLVILFSLSFIDIPAPQKKIKENYLIEVE